MKFKLLYCAGRITAVESYLAANNPMAIGSRWQDIHAAMISVARKNAKYVIEDISGEKWQSSIGTAGYLIQFMYAGLSKKGYPIIHAEIYVQPSFDESEYIEENFEL